MAYSRVTRTANGRGAIAYAEGQNGKGHNQHKVRNQVIGYVNLLPNVPVADQMQKYWNLARKNHKTQVIRVVQSFSRNELDPDNPMDIECANHVGMVFAKKYYPNRQCVVYTQIDGKAGLVHNHIIINDIEMVTHKGCEKEQYHYSSVEKWTDEIAAKYMRLDNGKAKTADKVTQTERSKREKGLYGWKDDLKKRIRDAMENAESEEQFLSSLPGFGVNVTMKNQTRGKKRGRYYTYELADLSLVPEGTKLPKNVKVRSYKLGTIYDAEGVANFYAARKVFMQRNSATAGTPKRAESRGQAAGVPEPGKKMSRQEFMDARGLKHFLLNEDGVLIGVDWDAYERNGNLYRKYLEEQEEVMNENMGQAGQDDECPELEKIYERGDKMKIFKGVSREKAALDMEEKKQDINGKTDAGQAGIVRYMIEKAKQRMKERIKEEQREEELLNEELGKEARRKEELLMEEQQLKKKRKAAKEDEERKKERTVAIMNERNRKKAEENSPVSPEVPDEDDIDNIGEPIKTQRQMSMLDKVIWEKIYEEDRRRKAAMDRVKAVRRDSHKAAQDVCRRDANGHRITSLKVAERLDHVERKCEFDDRFME